MTHSNIYKRVSVSYHCITRTLCNIFHFLRPAFNFISHIYHTFFHYIVIHHHIASWNLRLYMMCLKHNLNFWKYQTSQTVFKCLRIFIPKYAMPSFVLNIRYYDFWEQHACFSNLLPPHSPSPLALLPVHTDTQTHNHTHTHTQMHVLSKLFCVSMPKALFLVYFFFIINN